MTATTTKKHRKPGRKPSLGPKSSEHLAMRVTPETRERFQRIAGELSYPQALTKLMDRWESEQ